LADDMGFSDVGCYGSGVDTPNIDRLAEEGMRFSQMYNAARCTPTRGALLTGLHPHQTGMGHMRADLGIPAYRGHLNDRCVTMAEVLGAAGYTTLMSGKWHLGKAHAHWPNARGFDVYSGLLDGASDYFNPPPNRTIVRKNAPFAPKSVAYFESEDHIMSDFYMTDFITEEAVDQLKRHGGGEQPFFQYLAYTAPHWPLQAREEDIEKYRGRFMEGWDRIRRRRYERLIEAGLIDEDWSLSARDERVPPWAEAENKERWDLKMAAYAAQIDRMDQNIGRLLRKLETMGVADNTLVLFLSDNGSAAEDWINSQNPLGVPPGGRTCKLAAGPPWANVSVTPFRFYKQWTHEGGISTPFVARWPGEIEPGTLSHEVGHVMDILPTCLDVAGVEYPEQWGGASIQDYEGQSLRPAFEGKTWAEERTLMWEHVGNRAVRKGDWKLVSSTRFTPGTWELYDMQADRTETQNLIEQYPDKAAELEADWQRWADRVGVVMPED
ncbi:MAG: arylsulfatase, partial [Salinibacter sp.]